MHIGSIHIDMLFGALADELALRRSPLYELCVVGGSALGLLGLIDRPTKDIDVVALAESEGTVLSLRHAGVLPQPLVVAIAEVAVQLGIDGQWLNNGPASLMDCGLPDGFESRLTSRRYGSQLRIHIASRADQICLKTYAAADVAGRHLTDLVALSPTGDEMSFAFAWVMQQDDSAALRSQLAQLADYLEVRDALDSISR